MNQINELSAHYYHILKTVIFNYEPRLLLEVVTEELKTEFAQAIETRVRNVPGTTTIVVMTCPWVHDQNALDITVQVYNKMVNQEFRCQKILIGVCFK